MSRILEALKKAAPSVSSEQTQATRPVETGKPIIFEKVDLSKPALPVQQDMEAKKDAARRRYVLNEPAARLAPSSDSGRFFAILTGLILAALLLMWFWPKPSAGPKALVQENRQLRQQVRELQAQVSQAETELETLRKTASERPEDGKAREDLDAARAEIKRMNRRLTIMLQDNLQKDEQIARLSGR